MSLNIVKQFARDTDELQLPDAIGTGVTSGRGGQWGWVELSGRSTDEVGATDLIQLTATGANDLRYLIPAGAGFHFLIQWGLHSGDAYRADELRSDMTDGQANYVELGARRIEDNRFPQRQVLLGVDFSRDSSGRGVVGGIHKLTGTATPARTRRRSWPSGSIGSGPGMTGWPRPRSRQPRRSLNRSPGRSPGRCTEGCLGCRPEI